MTQRLVVISGPANSGKMPLAKKLMAEDKNLICVHRDDFRRIFVNPVDEGHITESMACTAVSLLDTRKYSVIVVAWNLEPEDRQLWENIAWMLDIPLEWLDVREPEVAAMIPPPEGISFLPPKSENP